MASSMVPLLNPNDTVLVTGANGFLGTRIVYTLLEKGFAVRGVVRSSEKAEYLHRLFAKHTSKFSSVIVEDITADGAYDEAVEGAQGVIHTSSPFTFSLSDLQDYIAPSVNGTLSLLDSIKKNAPTVKRVVVTSSVLALLDLSKTEPYVYSDSDWNDLAVKDVEANGAKAHPFSMYAASKVMGERAFWEYLKKPDTQFDGVTVLPTGTIGPLLQKVLNESTGLFVGPLNTPPPDPSVFLSQVGPGTMADVRDVAEVHVQALLQPQAAGRRFIVSSPDKAFNLQNIYDVINAHPELGITAPKGNPGAGLTAPRNIDYDVAPLESVLGIKQRAFDEFVVDAARSCKENGFLSK